MWPGTDGPPRARRVAAAGWDAERTRQFLTLMVEFNHGIEQLEGASRPGAGRAPRAQ